MSDEAPIDWLEDEDTSPARIARIARFVRTWAGLLAALAMIVGGVLAIWAAHLLANADVGSRLRERSCDSSPLWPLILFVIAGLLLALAPRLLLLRTLTTIVSLRVGIALIAAIVPTSLLLITMPGTLGCSAARTIARWQLFGDAFTGNAGIALCVASAFGLGMALASALHVGAVLHGDQLEREQPTIVELAMQEADELERDTELRRFRGVD